MKNEFKAEGKFFKKNERGQVLEINMGGGSLYEAHKELGLTEVKSVEYLHHKEHGFCETQNFVTLFKDQKGNFYYRTYMHFNGHMSGYKEGVYEVTFKKMIKC